MHQKASSINEMISYEQASETNGLAPHGMCACTGVCARVCACVCSVWAWPEQVPLHCVQLGLFCLDGETAQHNVRTADQRTRCLLHWEAAVGKLQQQQMQTNGAAPYAAVISGWDSSTVKPRCVCVCCVCVCLCLCE